MAKHNARRRERRDRAVVCVGWVREQEGWVREQGKMAQKVPAWRVTADILLLIREAEKKIQQACRMAESDLPRARDFLYPILRQTREADSFIRNHL
jgi:hypothetical protein